MQGHVPIPTQPLEGISVCSGMRNVVGGKQRIARRERGCNLLDVDRHLWPQPHLPHDLLRASVQSVTALTLFCLVCALVPLALRKSGRGVIAGD